MKHVTVTLTLGVPCWKEDEDNVQDVLDALKATIELESAMLVLSVAEVKAFGPPFHIEGSVCGRFPGKSPVELDRETEIAIAFLSDEELGLKKVEPFWWARQKRVLRA